MVGVVTELGSVMEQERVRGEPDTNTDCEADTITSGLGTAWSNENSTHHNKPGYFSLYAMTTAYI